MSNTLYTNAQQGQLRRLLPDLIRARQLLFDLIWKDIRIRYRYAVIGFAWAVLEPLFMMLVLTFVFSFVFKLDFGRLGSDAGHGFNAVFILTGLLAWQFLATSLTAATSSLVDNEDLVTKVGFPREVIPLSTIGVATVNLAIGGVLLLALYALFVGSFPGMGLAWLLVVFAIQLALVVGLGLVCSTFNAYFRDVSYMVNAVLLFGFYATPIFYEPSLVREVLSDQGLSWLTTVYYANPMVGLITSYRTILFEGGTPAVSVLWWPVVSSIAIFLFGAVTFRRHSPTIADEL